jgi:hypothetical protein
MRISEIAKDYLRQTLDEGAYEQISGRDELLMSRDDLIRHRLALQLLNVSLMAAIRNKSEPSYEVVAQEIDRRESLMLDGWKKEGARFVKEFANATELLEAWRALKDSFLLKGASRSPTDDDTKLYLSPAEHRALTVIMEGRITELE